MAIGDDALAAGMTLVNGNLAGSAAQIDEYINETRDEIARRTSAVMPITKGGTGATSAAGALGALGAVADVAAANTLALDWIGSRMVMKVDGTNQGEIAKKSETDALLASVNDRLWLGGGTVVGDVFLPNASPATSGFTVCYINTDGRISRGSSSARHKKYIHDAPDLGDLFAAPLREYRMRVDGIVPDDGVKHIGYIAEELVGTDMERFVVVINDQVESIDFIALLLAQVAQLNARVANLEAGE